MSRLIRQIDDQTQAGATPSVNLNMAGTDDDFLLADRIVALITVSGAKAAAGAGTWTTNDWLKNSTLRAFYRDGGKADGSLFCDGMPLLHLGRLATTALDGSLDNADSEFPLTQATTGGAVVDQFTFALRLPLSFPAMFAGDDGATRLSEIGSFQFSFGDANAAANYVISSVRVRLEVLGRQTNAKRAGIRLRYDRQSSQAPQTSDTVPCAPNEKLVYVILSSENTGDDMNDVTFPQVSQKGRALLDTRRIDTLAQVQGVQGEAFYPQLVQQTAVAATAFAPILVPDCRSKTSELVGDGAVKVECTANNLTAGAAFYCCIRAIRMDPVQAAVRLGLSDLGQAASQPENAGKPLSEAVVGWMPVEA